MSRWSFTPHIPKASDSGRESSGVGRCALKGTLKCWPCELYMNIQTQTALEWGNEPDLQFGPRRLSSKILWDAPTCVPMLQIQWSPHILSAERQGIIKYVSSDEAHQQSMIARNLPSPMVWRWLAGCSWFQHSAQSIGDTPLRTHGKVTCSAIHMLTSIAQCLERDRLLPHAWESQLEYGFPDNI